MDEQGINLRDIERIEFKYLKFKYKADGCTGTTRPVLHYRTYVGEVGASRTGKGGWSEWKVFITETIEIPAEEYYAKGFTGESIMT